MMRPHFAGIIDFSAMICVRTKAPLRFTFTSLSHASSGCCSAGAPQVAPALFTRMSTLPNFFSTASASGAIASRLPMSPTNDVALPRCFTA